MVSRRVRLLASCLTATAVTLASGRAAQATAPPGGIFPAAVKAAALPLSEARAKELKPALQALEKTTVSKDTTPVVPQASPVVPPAPAAPCRDTPACDTCCKPACDSCCTKGKAGPVADELFWVSGEYLLWFVKSGGAAFPLVTSGLPGGPDTRVLFGTENLSGRSPYSGVRVRAGTYLDDLGVGFDAGGFLLEQRGTTFNVASDTASGPVIARPFLNTATNTESVNLLSAPNTVTGGINIAARTQLWGAEANLTRRVELGPIEMLYVGFRYLTLEEDLSIDDRSTLVPGGLGFFDGLPVSVGDTRLKNDFFRTQNDFYGGQVGMKAAYRAGRFDVNLRSAVGFGVNVEKVTVRGSTTLIPVAGPVATVPGGLLALASNSRDESRSEFAVVPEVDLSFGYQLAPWARLFVGYNFLYVSSVARAGEQMERNINPVGLPISPNYDPAVNAVNPRPVTKSTDFWTQGVNFGVGVSF